MKKKVMLQSSETHPISNMATPYRRVEIFDLRKPASERITPSGILVTAINRNPAERHIVRLKLVHSEQVKYNIAMAVTTITSVTAISVNSCFIINKSFNDG